ncbi:copper homeostasis CutC domain-containing protein [Chaetomium sp. MPI-SDFR-AT-0129]|nr:copper homeostasis CutC domain-containing protein [Chaetomium sp. MPI-SDFR-AT-0129]
MTSSTHPDLEVPIFGPDHGVLAVSLGARRLELNRAGSYSLGGTTPTIAELSSLLASFPLSSPTTTPPRPTIRIMIRPRGPPSLSQPQQQQQQQQPHEDQDQQDQPQDQTQDFIYTPTELSTMTTSIPKFLSPNLLSPAHNDGFVFGILHHNPHTNKLALDRDQNSALTKLIKSASSEERSLKCVLHRAVDDLFDDIPADDREGLERVIEEVRMCGFDGMLTSGGKGDAVGNVERLRVVVEVGREKGVDVIVGGGVRKENLGLLLGGGGGGLGIGGGGLRAGGGVWFHSSCLKGEEFDEEEVKGLVDVLRGG